MRRGSLVPRSGEEHLDLGDGRRVGGVTPTTERNKDVVRRLCEALRAGDVDAFDDLVAEGYVQHDPMAGNGRAAVKALFAQAGPLDVEVHRMIAEGDLVAAHSHARRSTRPSSTAGASMTRGKLSEHWDVTQQVPETTVSGNDTFSQLT